MIYQPAHIQFLRDNATLPRRELADKFNARFGTALGANAIKATCTRYKIMTGRSGRFEKGNVPSPNARPKGPSKTSFKKGHRPHTWTPVGHERIDNKDGYVHVKTAEPNVFRLKHCVIWEEHNGNIPEGHVVTFVDGNKLNLDINNLELITRHELLIRNGLQLSACPEPVRESVKLLARVKVTAFQMEKKL